jgi:hypothetical protein
MLHGCCRSAKGYWEYDPSDGPEFFGLPEDVSHTRQALARGYAVLVPEPQDARTWCWSGTDLPQLVQLLTHFLKTHDLVKKPIYVIGGSSGSGVAMRLPLFLESTKAEFDVDGIINEVNSRWKPTDRHVNTPKFPPILWVVMERDADSIPQAREHVVASRKLGRKAEMVIARPKLVEPHIFTCIKGIEPRVSEKIATALQHIGLIDGNGEFLDNPKNYMKKGAKAWQWPTRLQKMLPFMSPKSPLFTLILRRSPVWQVLTRAYCQHEHVADYTTAGLEWLESKGLDRFERTIDD